MGEMDKQMASQDSTEILVNRAQSGDRDAFDEIVRVYCERLKHHIGCHMGSRLRGKLEIEDILQETFTVAFETINKFQWRGEAAFYRWLGSISEHVILTSSQKRAWSQIRLSQDVTAKGHSPSENLRRNERFDRLEEALANLSKDHREVLRLARIEGLKVKEIAVRMKRSPDAIWKLLARATLQLKESFGDTESLHLPDRRFRTNGGRGYE